jgi:hypothetical protein
MKKTLICCIFLGMFAPVQSQSASYDTVAIMILDHMSNILGELSSCSFRLNTSTDISDPESGIITTYEISDASFYGPDKMLVKIKGGKGHRGYWYNGQKLIWYSFDENNFVVVDAPDNIVDMIDTIHSTYGFVFPAADFFYPSFTDDLINNSEYNSENIIYKGTTYLDGQECFHILARNTEMNVQFWIANNPMFLPVKFLINYANKTNVQRYEATFSNWQINPELPPTMFEFTPPPSAKQVSIVPRKSK